MDITALTFNERDEFKRKSIAEKAISLLQAEIDISPMVIDGSWGTGKSEFCHKLINLMNEQESHHLIYIDAFKADHANEPLMTVLAEVIKVLPEDESKQSFVKKALPAVRYGLKTIAKAGVSHLLRQDAADVVDDFDKQIQQAADKTIDATVESILKDHVEAEKNLKALQEAMAEIAAEKPIVLFVDELDRCRPNFAVDMLEIIKHTFDVNGVQFVLVTNTQQLKASVNHCYGAAVDAQRYLDKFIKFRFELSPISESIPKQPQLAALEHFQQLVKSGKQVPDERAEDESLEYLVIKSFIIQQKLSLREIETFYRYLCVANHISPNFFNDDLKGNQLFKITSLMMFCFNPNLLDKIRRREASIIEFSEFIGVRKIDPLFDGKILKSEQLMVVLFVLYDSFHDKEKFVLNEESLKGWNELINQYFDSSISYLEGYKIIEATTEILSLGK
ncbi:KAP family P-loop NTPase fold protein [Pseudoalteromonas luteoviolacea]|uniref:KAP NTPase domain-containing protein n=1 Tax=Pseudoalteromonas luteoviolacea S4054 TaxID=1129367 RepID=A0A0F6AI33_9GAMM|nr:KAP family NTPase [Pseudoalteromonas luteoviolacea]KKE85441.1 hypothetical protein N479_05405 [Pseudoalteromonas luteoviolacea S4054]KZN73789.1 hypothetical protein N481_11815 [Pseudoalteromonas luteoviolacea S4047-1]